MTTIKFRITPDANSKMTDAAARSLVGTKTKLTVGEDLDATIIGARMLEDGSIEATLDVAADLTGWLPAPGRTADGLDFLGTAT